MKKTEFNKLLGREIKVVKKNLKAEMQNIFKKAEGNSFDMRAAVKVALENIAGDVRVVDDFYLKGYRLIEPDSQ